jgi:hypothetical protein
MAEHDVADSPLWYRGPHDPVGQADAQALGLTVQLRQDLRRWNDAQDTRVDGQLVWPSAAVRDAHRVEAFALASRVQSELGDEVLVWCGGGTGVGTLTTGGEAIVLSVHSTATDVETWSGGRSEVRTARAAGAREGTARAIERWRTLTEHVPSPLGDASTRALGLRVAGRLQADVATRSQVAFFAGAPAS